LIQRSIDRCQPMCADHRAGIYARGLPHTQTFIGGKSARADQRRGLRHGLAWEIDAKKTPGYTGVAGKSPPCSIIDLLLRFRGSLSQISLCHFVSSRAQS
jgi:hypothetical protein